MKYEAIRTYCSEFKVAKMCNVLRIRQSGYYQWRRGAEKRLGQGCRELEWIRKIESVFEEHRKTYGYRRIHCVLAERGIEISEYKVKMLMRESGLYPVTTRKYKPYPKQKSDGKYSEDKVLQGFNVDMPDKIWAGDITYIKTALGWVYLAVVIDLYNREVVGYSISKKIDTELVKRSVCNALGGRKDTTGLIFHSDRGCQYSSMGFHKYLQESGIAGSMSKAGCPYDNSCMESFFATMKKECIYRKNYATIEEIETDLFEYIQLFYNRKRIHSTLGYLSPVNYRIKWEGGKVA